VLWHGKSWRPKASEGCRRGGSYIGRVNPTRPPPLLVLVRRGGLPFVASRKYL
jgi:hypothetical protein